MRAKLLRLIKRVEELEEKINKTGKSKYEYSSDRGPDANWMKAWK